MRFETETGSIYEVDEETRCIRRVSGKAATTIRFEGDWKPYDDISAVALGKSVCVFWPKTVPLLPGSPSQAVPGTITSPVVRVWP